MTGVQTCALPICGTCAAPQHKLPLSDFAGMIGPWARGNLSTRAGAQLIHGAALCFYTCTILSLSFSWPFTLPEPSATIVSATSLPRHVIYPFGCVYMARFCVSQSKPQLTQLCCNQLASNFVKQVSYPFNVLLHHLVDQSVSHYI